jgi:hypothetical protein
MDDGGRRDFQAKKLACVREITQAKEVVPGTASIYGLCFSASWIIPVSNAAVCDRILRIISYQKITLHA